MLQLQNAVKVNELEQWRHKVQLCRMMGSTLVLMRHSGWQWWA
jgi:hypothetical protein